MYLWKCWRETRWIFGIALACVLLAALLSLQIPPPHVTITHEVSNGHGVVQTHSENNALLPLLAIPKSAGLWFYPQLLPLALLAWFLGGRGLGHNLGESSGNFLLTRPWRRSRFILADWAVGIGELLTIIVLINLLYAVQVYRFRGYFGLATNSQQLLAYTAVLCLASLAVSGLVYGITYCFTIITQHGRGAIFAGGCLVAYPIVSAIVHDYWHAIRLPSLIPHIVHQVGTPLLGLAPWQPQILIRAGLVLACLFLSQAVLQRSDFA